MWTHGSPCELRSEVAEVKAGCGSHGKCLQHFLIPETLWFWEKWQPTTISHNKTRQHHVTSSQHLSTNWAGQMQNLLLKKPRHTWIQMQGLSGWIPLWICRNGEEHYYHRKYFNTFNFKYFKLTHMICETRLWYPKQWQLAPPAMKCKNKPYLRLATKWVCKLWFDRWSTWPIRWYSAFFQISVSVFFCPVVNKN